MPSSNKGVWKALFWLRLLSVSVSVYSDPGHCPSDWPCAETYPASPTGDVIEIGALVSVDVNEPWALAMRAFVEIIVDEINADSAMLPSHTLVAVWGALGGVSESGGIFSVLHTGLVDGNVFNITRRVPLLVGPLWSSVAKPAAIVASRLDIAILGAACSSPELSNDELYPTFSRVYPADDATGVILAQMLYDFGFRKVAVIARNDAWGTGISTAFVAAADSLGMELLAVTQFDEKVTDGESQLRLIKSSLARIIVTFVFESNKFLRAAARVGMIGPLYQYVAGDGVLSFPLEADNQPRAKSMLVVLPTIDRSSAGYLNVKNKFESKTANDASSTYNATFSNLSLFFTYYYDCMLFGVKALHELAERGFDMRTVPQANVTAQLRNQSLDSGVSGLIKLNAIGDRIGNFETLNYQQKSDSSYEWVTVGHFENSFQPVSGVDILWSTGSSKTPKDAVGILHQFDNASQSAVTTLWIFAAFGLVMCVLTFAFNMHYRELRYIKMSSPHVNNLILLGCALAYLSIFLLAINLSNLTDRAVSVICHLKFSNLMVSFTLAFGGLFAKTWRVFRLFVNKNFRTVAISNRQLFGHVAMMLSLDLIVSVVWILVEPMERHRTFGVSYPDPNDPDILIVPVVETCSSPNMAMFTGVVIAYKSLLIIGGATLAVLTQKVNIKALNDSRQIGLCIYTVGLVTSIVIPLLFVVRDKVTVNFVFSGFALWFCTSSVIAILFVYKMYMVYSGAHEDQTKTTARSVSNSTHAHPNRTHNKVAPMDTIVTQG